MRSETLAGKWFFDVAVSEKLENVININMLEVVSLKMRCFVTCSCCQDDFWEGVDPTGGHPNKDLRALDNRVA